MITNTTIEPSNGKALLPFAVFIFTFLGVGILMEDFYAIPSPIAVFLGIITAFLFLKGKSEEKLSTLLKGCGEQKILTMCLIYLLAGAFATVTSAMGGVDSTVNLGLSLIPTQFLAAGIFLLAAFLSISTGTSVGAIVALGPIAIGLADNSGISLSLLLASLLGGAMFGDNLSVISDTTIAATQTQGCKMKDKFKINLFIAVPAALLSLIILLFAGNAEIISQSVSHSLTDYSLLSIFPYILVLVLAIAGVNVFTVLTLGTLSAGIIGIASGNFGLLEFGKKVYEGFNGMSEIFLLSMLTGGLAALVKEAGGINYLLKKVEGNIRGRKSAQLGIGALVSLTDLSIANNTVSIIITGPIAKQISETHSIDKRKTAALIDIFACIMQGILPYGAQVLILLGFTSGRLTYWELIPNVWYLFALLGFSLLAIYSPLWDRIIQKRMPV